MVEGSQEENRCVAKKIFLPSSGGDEKLLAAAQFRGGEVIEFQDQGHDIAGASAKAWRDLSGN